MFVDDKANMERRERASITLHRAALFLLEALKEADEAIVYDPVGIVNFALEGTIYELREVK